MKYIVDIDRLKDCLDLLPRSWSDDGCVEMHDVMEMIDRFPKKKEKTEVVHGEWIIEKSDTCYWYACSECGGYIPLNQYKKEWYSDFCPNCGAKMDGKEEGVKND